LEIVRLEVEKQEAVLEEAKKAQQEGKKGGKAAKGKVKVPDSVVKEVVRKVEPGAKVKGGRKAARAESAAKGTPRELRVRERKPIGLPTPTIEMFNNVVQAVDGMSRRATEFAKIFTAWYTQEQDIDWLLSQLSVWFELEIG
jgi:hypothetical protein